MSGEKANRIYKTYKNTVMPHERHIYAKVSDMEKATTCEFPQSDHAFATMEMCHAVLCQMYKR